MVECDDTKFAIAGWWIIAGMVGWFGKTAEMTAR